MCAEDIASLQQAEQPAGSRPADEHVGHGGQGAKVLHGLTCPRILRTQLHQRCCRICMRPARQTPAQGPRSVDSVLERFTAFYLLHSTASQQTY